jgi:hypothetical protein
LALGERCRGLAVVLGQGQRLPGEVVARRFCGQREAGRLKLLRKGEGQRNVLVEHHAQRLIRA